MFLTFCGPHRFRREPSSPCGNHSERRSPFFLTPSRSASQAIASRWPAGQGSFCSGSRNRRRIPPRKRGGIVRKVHSAPADADCSLAGGGLGALRVPRHDDGTRLRGFAGAPPRAIHGQGSHRKCGMCCQLWYRCGESLPESAFTSLKPPNVGARGSGGGWSRTNVVHRS